MADQSRDIEAIRQLQADWNRAVEAGNIDGYVAVLDPDIELLPTDAEPIVGAAAYREFLGPVFEADTFSIDVVAPAEIDVTGDIAWARYDYVIHRTPKDSGETFSARRKFLDVLRRRPDGAWGVYKHIWNYNTPDATP